jgi:PAP2 superfamily protein
MPAELLPLLVALLYISWAWVRFGTPTWDTRLATSIAGFGLVIPALAVVRLRLIIGGPPSAWRLALQRANAEGWLRDRLLWFLGLLAVLPAFFWAFAAWKSAIPPFRYDPELARVDRLLFGIDPYRLLRLSPAGLAAWDEVYYWGFNGCLLGVMLWQAWTPRGRVRFWLAFALTWILLGTCLASVVSSAGPIFYPQVTGSMGPFADLFGAIDLARHDHSLKLLEARAYLWSLLQRGEIGVGSGISAFPSLHIAVPTLAACAARGPLRWLLGALAAILWVGSFTLGWHYAVDGIASIVLTPMIWLLSSRVTSALGGGKAVPGR